MGHFRCMWILDNSRMIILEPEFGGSILGIIHRWFEDAMNFTASLFSASLLRINSMSIWESFASNDVAHSSAVSDTDGPVSPCFTIVHHVSVLNRQILSGILDFLRSGSANLEKRWNFDEVPQFQARNPKRHKKPIRLSIWRRWTSSNSLRSSVNLSWSDTSCSKF